VTAAGCASGRNTNKATVIVVVNSNGLMVFITSGNIIQSRDSKTVQQISVYVQAIINRIYLQVIYILGHTYRH
jgi:hypothetical protein